MRPWIFFDTEDDSLHLVAAGKSGFGKRVTHIAAKDYRGKTYYSAGDITGFLAWCSARPKADIWAHNCGYDLGGLFGDNLDDLDWTLVRNKMVRARWDGHSFLDSHNIFPMPLEDLGEALGIQKLDMSDSKARVIRDVDIGWAGIARANRFCEESGVDMAGTMGGVAVKLWTAGGGQAWFDGFYLSREAMHAGRVEIFRPACNEPMVYGDINSLYPWALTQAYPGPVSVSRDLDAPFGLASVRIKVPQDYISVLPVRKGTGAIAYPWGEFNGVWTLAEIRAAEARGAVVQRVFECYASKQGEFYYKDFIEHYHKRKQKAKNEGDRLMFKLLLNSFGGNLGMTGKITRSVNLQEHLDDDGIPFGRKKMLEIQITLPERVNYLHSAYMTAYGRLKMLELIEKIGVPNCVYLATDGLIWKKSAPWQPEFGDNLGDMRLVAEKDSFVAWDDNIWGFGDIYKAKGVKRSMAELFVKTKSAKFHIPFSVKEACVFFNQGNKRKLGVWRKVEKTLRKVYDKKRLRDGLLFPKKLTQRKYHAKLQLTAEGNYDVFADAERH